MVLLAQADPVRIGQAINEYGIATILACLLVFLWWAFRSLHKTFLDEEKGLVIVTHREMISSIKINSEANRINAEANTIHAQSHERTSRCLQTMLRMMKSRGFDFEDDSDVKEIKKE